jgi:hypothetical protein
VSQSGALKDTGAFHRDGARLSAPLYSAALVTGRAEDDAEIEAVRQLMRDVASCLPARRIELADELLRNDEPHEALLGIAWDLAPHRAELPENVVHFIREATGNSTDLHQAFRE